MKIKWITAFLRLTIVVLAIAGCTENNDSVTRPPQGSSIIFKDIQVFLHQPSQVQFTFRAADNLAHAVIVEPSQLPKPFRIFEDNAEVDYTETSYFVHPTQSLELDMVLLLDFTNSMATWQEGGKTGLDLEIEWAQELIDGLAATHRMAIVEHHDRNVEASLISSFSSDKATLHAALENFLNQNIDHGSSRVWDALYTAIGAFDGNPSDNKQRTVLFITDGRETSSQKTPAEATSFAKQWQANVFIIGAGSVSNEQILNSIALQTSGEYYLAADIASFREKLQQIKRDLGGQYKLSYITLQSEGTHTVKVQLDYNGLTGAFDSTLDLGAIYGDDRVGEITFDQPSLNGDRLDIVIRAQHVPRNIDRFRLRLETAKSYNIALIPASEGGLCDSWTIAGPDAQGYYDISSTTALLFGDFGPLFRISVSGVVEASLNIPFLMDNTIYSAGKRFDFPAEISYGGNQ